MSNKALIIVDVQNDFLPGGSLEVPDGDEVIPVINKIQEKFDLVVATQDWHPEGHASFASKHEGKEPMEKGEVNGQEQVLWPDHCVQGSNGAKFSEDLDLKKAEAIFRKGTNKNFDSYSGFYDLGHEYNTGLSGFLKDKGVKEVYLAGLAADVCVKFTALDALKEGFTTYYLKDATKAVELEDGDFEKAMVEVKEKGGKVISVEEI